VTAEVVVMNRQGVALAADSAVTIESEGDRKAWQSANKIFGLSHRHPVGVMVYGGADLMGVPWDTVVKVYRERLGVTSFNTVSEYVDDFLRFLQANRQLFPAREQARWFEGTLVAAYKTIVDDIVEVLRTQYPNNAPITLAQIRAVVSARVDFHVARMEAFRALPHVSAAESAALRRRYGSIITRVRRDLFQSLPLTSAASAKLGRFASLLFAKRLFGNSASGVVVAGFGDREHFPRFESLTIEGVIGNRVNYDRDPRVEVSNDNAAIVQAFAQGEMVYSFMEGVNQDYQRTIDSVIDSLTSDYPVAIVDNLSGVSAKRKLELKTALGGSADKISGEVKERLRQVRERYYAMPIVRVVSVLPRDELAAMAEALVNLTSFRRKVSLQVETVGGPIDVAVISKGDGFVWIKRKNYFDIESNPHVMARYLARR
jgi:hypothetical protein